MFEIHNLPPEIVIRIFNMLSKKDLSNVVLVCKQWKEMVEENPKSPWVRLFVHVDDPNWISPGRSASHAANFRSVTDNNTIAKMLCATFPTDEDFNTTGKMHREYIKQMKKTSVNIKLKKSLFKTQSAKKKTTRNLPPFAQETMTLGDNEQTFGND